VILRGAAQGDERTRERLLALLFRFLQHILDADVIKKSHDPIMYLPERPFDGAAHSVTAMYALGEAIGENDRSVYRPNDLESGNFSRIARQPIPAVGSVLRDQETSLAKLLQKL